MAFEQLRLEHQLCFALYDASRAVVRAYGPLLADVGLTYPQYLALLVLWEAHPDEVAVGEVRARLHLETGTVTPLLQRLDAAGLVTRRRDPADERRVLVALTEAGVALRRQVAGVPAQLFGSLGLDGPAALELKGQLERLTATLGALDRA